MTRIEKAGLGAVFLVSLASAPGCSNKNNPYHVSRESVQRTVVPVPKLALGVAPITDATKQKAFRYDGM